MDMTGEYRIPLPQGRVWDALNDTEILKASIPGCEELTRESETRLKGRIAAAVGPVRAKFSGEATLSDIDAPNGYTLTGSGSGGAAGMVKGGAKVRLIGDADGTILRYEANAQVAGKLAQIGSRLVDMAAKKMADEFFGNFVRQLEPAAIAEAPLEHTAVEQTLPAKTDSRKRSFWIIWGGLALAVVIAALLLGFFNRG
jgi:carbon monoxide dehydrogenase subunit G